MDNNTQIETVEQAAHKILTEFGVKSIGDNINAHSVKGLMILMASWQKQQDEAKYKELLDSHNELLEGIKEISEVSNGIGVLNQNWLKGFCEELINKAKNIKL